MFTPDVARNFAGPDVVVSAGLLEMVLLRVSIVFAVVYVPK